MISSKSQLKYIGSESQTKLLISTYVDHEEEMESRKTKKKDVWRKIAAAMNKGGCHVTGTNVKNKWRRNAKGGSGIDDLLYSAWMYLKRQTDGQLTELTSIKGQEDDDHLLSKAGLIPKRLAEVFRNSPDKEKPMRHSATTGARVLTGEEISCHSVRIEMCIDLIKCT